MEAVVVILMGSGSDMEQATAIAGALAEFEIKAELRIGSAHKTPAHVLNILETYEADPRAKVYVTIAGRSNALSGFVDAQVNSPVIACPPISGAFSGADIFSSLRMPSGVAPAVVLAPSGAALLAAKILGIYSPEIQAKVIEKRRGYVDKILQDDGEVGR